MESSQQVRAWELQLQVRGRGREGQPPHSPSPVGRGGPSPAHSARPGPQRLPSPPALQGAK